MISYKKSKFSAYILSAVVLGTLSLPSSILAQGDSLNAEYSHEQKWLSKRVGSLTKDDFNELFANKIPCIHVPNFITQEDSHNLCQKAEEVGFDYYQNVLPKMGRIGITQFESFEKPKSTYFNLVPNAFKKQNAVFNFPNINVMDKTKLAIADTLETKIEVASEEGYGSYFSGLMRQISSGKIHFDYAPYDAQGWSISQAAQQLSWNIYLEVPSGAGGELIVYDKLWQEGLYDDYRLPGHKGSYGFDTSLVESTNFFSIKPKCGDLWIFNTRNFHEILRSEEKRTTASSFLGRTSSGKLFMWS